MLSIEKITEGEVLLINKPLRWTSFDVVNKIRILLTNPSPRTANTLPPTEKYKIKRNIKVGHAGTLDPLATGLLIVCTGKMTKTIDELQAKEKEYTGTFMLGSTTPSFDLETEVNGTFPTEYITEGMIRDTAKKFIGKILQIPPAYSAVKIGGKRAYDLARAGKTPDIKPKEITITEFEITKIQMPAVEFKVVCSKGTYIRTLVADFGKVLSNGAYLSSLCRTRIGSFRLEQALTLEDFAAEIGVEFTSGNRIPAISKKKFH